ncbi:endogenous retrovirus group K member 6 Gag polyprotein-like [Ammospiza nelsoni]|uniref:endogenous retrovirus group K member 6 Gag polyprotein-like n=1 Tax=Ammospiza nelsoni TaxID=2857394 RepID=UPI00286C015B|nr:endogenous retrovirus group K member 6 Gag polyprotein-like [Ammospiza nelsoni]
MGKLWRVINNELLQFQAEKRAAYQATAAHDRNKEYDQEREFDKELGTPRGPAMRTVSLPASSPPSASQAPSQAVSPATSQAPSQAPQSALLPSAPLPPPPLMSQPPLTSQAPQGAPQGALLPALPQAMHSTSESPVLLASQQPGPQTCVPFPKSNQSPGLENDRAVMIARERRDAWAALAKDAMEKGDQELISLASKLACPVIFTPQAGGGMQATISALDWKMLSQLRATVSQFGFKSEPAKQMLDYIFDTSILLINDCRGIVKLIFTQHQQLLFNAHWQALVNECVAVQRQQGDPLHGVTVNELMGLGPFLRTEAQALIGQEKCREAMRLVRLAIERVKEPGGIPVYMGIKQGREESFGAFIDRAAAAIERAGVAEFMRGALLKQCAIQNCNSTTRNILNTLGANWTIEEALERMALVPTGQQALVVDAIKQLGVGLQEQAKSSQNQVLAALAPLQASAAFAASNKKGRMKCYRCGGFGHTRQECQATGIWCQKCRMDNHHTSACKRRSGNFSRSAYSRSSRAQTQVAAAEIQPPRAFNPPQQGASIPPQQAVSNPPQPGASNPPPQGASAWTWQPQ